MRLLNFSPRYAEPALIETPRLLLQRPHAGNFAQWASLRRASEEFLRPFEPTWATDELSRAAFRARLRRQEADITAGRGRPWFLFDKHNPDQLLGGLTVSNIRRGIADTGTLGYWMGAPFAGHGYMKEAVNGVCENLFGTHQLHRVEAATVPENERSQRLLTGAGFQKEGYARRYLKINGAWRDHLLFARLSDDQVITQ